MKIRKATLEDAEGIAKVHVDSWRTTYKEIIPSSYLNNLSYVQRTELWRSNISKENNHVVVAGGDAGQIIGFADSWKRENNITEHSGDLTSIYLLEEYQGKGIGKMLLKELFNHYKEMAYEKIFVEVLEDNKTRYFYEHYGARLIDTAQIKINGEILNELIYEWDDVDEVIRKLK